MDAFLVLSSYKMSTLMYVNAHVFAETLNTLYKRLCFNEGCPQGDMVTLRILKARDILCNGIRVKLNAFNLKANLSLLGIKFYSNPVYF